MWCERCKDEGNDFEPAVAVARFRLDSVQWLDQAPRWPAPFMDRVLGFKEEALLCPQHLQELGEAQPEPFIFQEQPVRIPVRV